MFLRSVAFKDRLHSQKHSLSLSGNAYVSTSERNQSSLILLAPVAYALIEVGILASSKRVVQHQSFIITHGVGKVGLSLHTVPTT